MESLNATTDTGITPLDPHRLLYGDPGISSLLKDLDAVDLFDLCASFLPSPSGGVAMVSNKKHPEGPVFCFPYEPRLSLTPMEIAAYRLASQGGFDSNSGLYSDDIGDQFFGDVPLFLSSAFSAHSVLDTFGKVIGHDDSSDTLLFSPRKVDVHIGQPTLPVLNRSNDGRETTPPISDVQPTLPFKDPHVVVVDDSSSGYRPTELDFRAPVTGFHRRPDGRTPVLMDFPLIAPLRSPRFTISSLAKYFGGAALCVIGAVAFYYDAKGINGYLDLPIDDVAPQTSAVVSNPSATVGTYEQDITQVSSASVPVVPWSASSSIASSNADASRFCMENGMPNDCGGRLPVVSPGPPPKSSVKPKIPPPNASAKSKPALTGDPF